MITKEASTKIVNFTTPRAGGGGFVLGHGHIRHIVKMRYTCIFKTRLLYSSR